MKLGDSYYSIIKNDLKVDEQFILETKAIPDHIIVLNGNLLLCQKKFTNNKFSLLLIATQIINNEEILALAYWIPPPLYSVNPLQTLLNFISSYGCRIRINEKEGLFLENINIESNEDDPNFPFSQITFLDSDIHLQYNTFLFVNETRHQENLNTFIYYAFGINHNRYFIWLHDVDTTPFQVPKGWTSFISPITAILNPFGGTKLKIMNSTKREFKKELIKPKEKEFDPVPIELPKYYLPAFKRISDVIFSLEDQDRITVYPYLPESNCIFCRSILTSQEHIFPKWLRNHINDKKIKYHFAIALKGENLFSAYKSPLNISNENTYGLTVNNICISCNTGWLSSLEEEAKKYLVGQNGELINSHYDIINSGNNKFPLARWICIKAILLSLRSKIPLPFLTNALSSLMNEKITDHFLIEITTFNNYDFNYEIQLGDPGIKGSAKVNKMSATDAFLVHKEFYKCCIQIGHLVFRISHLDESKGLKRNSFIKKTDLLFPENHIYLHTENEQTNITWNELSDKLKFKCFLTMGLMLDEI